MASTYPLSDSNPLPKLADLTLGDDKLSRIDVQIARLEDQIRTLRSLRNSLIPISRFPAEILSEVFSLCHRLDSVSNKSHLSVSWVSQHWRNVALGYPALWSLIHVDRFGQVPTTPATVEYLQECFIRSKELPLTVSYSGLLTEAEALAICCPQIHRIRQLYIRGGYPFIDSDPFLTEGWLQPSPLLDNLELWGIRLEPGLFGVAAPPLQKVCLYFCELTWDSPITRMSTITSLEIDRPADAITSQNFASMLQSMPVLGHCSIDYCLAHTEPAFVTEYQIRLPSLERLSIVGEDHDAIVELFQCVDLPNANVEIAYSTGRNAGNKCKHRSTSPISPSNKIAIIMRKFMSIVLYVRYHSTKRYGIGISS